jgi:hypothetical protein
VVIDERTQGQAYRALLAAVIDKAWFENLPQFRSPSNPQLRLTCCSWSAIGVGSAKNRRS